MKFRHLLRRFVLMNAFEEGGGGGVAEPTVVTAAEPAPGGDGAPAEPAQTALQAMFPDAPAATTEQPLIPGQPRDESGRFAQKPPVDPNAPAAQVAAKPAAPAVPGATAAVKPPVTDDLKMPDGLKPDAQQRFQKLANEVKELAPLREEVPVLREKVDMLTRQTEYIKTTFSEHNIQQPQFEQAAGIIGMINGRDYKGAMAAITEQLQQLSLLAGQPVAAVDALANFPDLRNAVDSLQVTEAHALEIARGRFQNNQTQQFQQVQQDQQQAAHERQREADEGLKAVDLFAKQMAATDIDYPRVEALLTKHLEPLLKTTPPRLWGALVKQQYQIIKEVAGQSRQAAPAQNLLRPAGVSSAKAAPQNGFEAMFGTARPAGA